MRLIDTHAHLYAEQFDGDRDKVIERAGKLGVDTYLLPNIDSSSIDGLYALCDKYPNNCFPMMGLHPCSVTANAENELAAIKAELDKRKFVAIGEIGLDYYWDTTFKEQQIYAFREQIGWAKERNLPIAIHTRNSFEDAIRIVEAETDGQLKGVFHCFSGTREDAERIMKTGFYMGIGGVLTFKNSSLAAVIQNVPLEALILETDAPYLAPVPHRGQRNESAYVFDIAKKLKEVKNVTLEEVADITTANAVKLFNL